MLRLVGSIRLARIRMYISKLPSLRSCQATPMLPTGSKVTAGCRASQMPWLMHSSDGQKLVTDAVALLLPLPHAVGFASVKAIEIGFWGFGWTMNGSNI